MRFLQLRQWPSSRVLSRPVRHLDFSAAGNVLAAYCERLPGLKAIDIHTGRPPELPACSDDWAIRPTFSHCGGYLAIARSNGRARVYRLADKQALTDLLPPTNSLGVSDLAFAPTDDPHAQWLAVCGNEFWLWNPLTQQYLVAPNAERFRSAAFDRDAGSVAVLTADAAVRFRLKPFAEVWRVPRDEIGLAVAREQSSRVRLSPDGTALAVFGGGQTLSILDPESGACRLCVRVRERISDLAFLPNSRLLAVAAGTPVLRVYDTDTGTVAREYDWSIGGIHCVTFSNDGAMGAAGGDKGRVVVWDVE